MRHLLDALIIIIIIIMIIVAAVVIIVMIIINSRIHTNTQPIFLFFSCRLKKKKSVMRMFKVPPRSSGAVAQDFEYSANGPAPHGTAVRSIN
jgi:hypothetical protein